MVGQTLTVKYYQARTLSKEEAERKYFYQFGSTISFAFTTIALFFGLFVLLSNPLLIQQPLVITYVVIFIGSIFGIVYIGFTGRFRRESISAGLLGGALGFFILVVFSLVFQTLSTLQLLETGPPGGVSITPFENWIYQLVFVAITEEIFFRHTLAYIVETALAGVTRFARQISLFLITPIMFGVIHFAAYELNFWNIFNAIIAGVLLGFVRYGWPKKKEKKVEKKVVVIDGTTIEVKKYRFGGLFASFLAHLIYNSIMLTQLLIVPWSF